MNPTIITKKKKKKSVINNNNNNLRPLKGVDLVTSGSFGLSEG